MDLDAVRTVVAVADAGQFQRAAAALSITQQAASKRVAALERQLGVALFVRTPRGAEPTRDGLAFLPHARELLDAADRAAASVAPDRRPLRVDVVASRAAPAGLLRGFHRARPDVALEVITHVRAGRDALAAVRAGELDAAFRAVGSHVLPLPAGLLAERVLDDRLALLVGPRHPLADAPALTLADLAGHPVWMPGIVPGSEWGAFYDDLAAAFGLEIDASGPNFGSDAMAEAIAASPALATFAGAELERHWPPGHDLRRIPLRDPTPVYPHSLVSRRGDRHPALAALRAHLAAARDAADAAADGAETWVPRWAQPIRR